MNLRGEVALTREAVVAKLLVAQEYYQSLEKLYFAIGDKSPKIKLKKDNTAESFVRKFFSKFSLEYRTYYEGSNNLYEAVDTRRSIGDIYRLAFCYLGNKITLEDIIIHTYSRIINDELTGNYCYRINKRVYKDRPAKNGSFFDHSYADELGLTQAHYNLLIKNT